MGSFLFKWSHPATEVYVTGTFDDWAKSVKLDRTANGFEKYVDLPSAEEKVIYKFVVDDNWTTDHTAPIQIDEDGNSNNILLPEHITRRSTGTVGGVAASLPGAFPATPAPNTENQAFSVDPIPATAGAGNPIKLAPGEKVPAPSTLTRNTIESTATMDKDSYEKSASGAPVLPNPITPEAERGADGAGLFGLPPISKNMIPESSLPMGGAAAHTLERDPGVTIRSGGGASSTALLAGQVPLQSRGVATTEPDSNVTIQSGGGAPSTAVLAGEVPLQPRGVATTEPDSNVTIQSGGGAPTTAALAAQVPVEPRGVPQVVQDSQDLASSDARGASTEATANPEAVLEKKSVNQEIKDTVQTEPASGGQSVGAKVAEIAGGAAAGATAAVAAAAAYATRAKDNITSDETKEAAGNAAAQAKSTAADAATKTQESATAAAAAVKAKLPESVQQKLETVLPTSAIGTGNEPAAPQVPSTVKDSIVEAKQPAEGAVNPTQVSNKSLVEEELKETVPVVESSGTPAPTATAATSATAPGTATIGKSSETPLATAGTTTTGKASETPLTSTAGKSSEAPLAAGIAGGATGAATLASTKTTGKSTESALNAPANAPTTTTAANPRPDHSREVSPMTRTEDQTGPVATSGITTTSIPASSGPGASTKASTTTPSASAPGASTNTSTTNPAVTAAQQAARSPTQVPPASPASTTESGTRSKRRSFFGRIKDKMQHKRGDSKSES